MTRNSPFTSDERERVVASMISHSGLNQGDAEKLLASFEQRRSARDLHLERQWVTNLAAVCRAISEGRAQPPSLFAAVFWIRLYGVITDLRDRFRKASELHAMLVGNGKSLPLLISGAEVFSACTAIRDCLSDEELVFAAFLRHGHAHVYQDGFEYSVERGNPAAPALRTKTFVGTTGKHSSIEDVHAIVNQVMADHGNDDSAVALTFAKKLWPGISRLVDAMNTFFGECQADAPSDVARSSTGGELGR